MGGFSLTGLIVASLAVLVASGSSPVEDVPIADKPRTFSVPFCFHSPAAANSNRLFGGNVMYTLYVMKCRKNRENDRVEKYKECVRRQTIMQPGRYLNRCARDDDPPTTLAEYLVTLYTKPRFVFLECHENIVLIKSN